MQEECRGKQSCAVYDGWVHKICGVNGRLQDVTDFECATSKKNHMVEARMERINIEDAALECIDRFYYLGDMIGFGRGCRN